MTLTIETGTFAYTFYSNVPNVTAGVFELTITSQWSNQEVIQVTPTLVSSNARYTKWLFTLGINEGDNHYNGMGNYTITKDGSVIDSGSLKLIYSPGGGTGTQSYISDNENRQADVFYRPAY